MAPVCSSSVAPTSRSASAWTIRWRSRAAGHDWDFVACILWIWMPPPSAATMPTWCRRSCVKWTSAFMNADVHFTQDLEHQVGIVAALGGGIQIHKMQATKSQSCPAARDLHRMIHADALLLVRATDQLHTCTITQIHRGNHDHDRASCRNAWTNATPGAELFSG